MKRYNPKEIEPRWQKFWDETGTYTTDLNSAKPKYLAMSMFNYPSGAGIHIGHAMNYTISDVKARFKRQQGFESYHPVGWDAFGLPAENYAIKSGVSPQESMATIIPGYHKQYKAMGWSNDWEKEIATHLPEYYKWTQWIFAQMFKHGLAYQDSRLQWWCPIDNTVLANEQVIDGKCWRHDGPDDPPVEKREVKQWFFKITEYADELLDAIDALDWTESVKLAQANWIGRSVGAEINFKIDADLKDLDFVLLHGYTGSSNEDFFPWLSKELQNRGAQVYAPDMPNTNEPNIEEQVEFVLKNHKFTDKTVLVTHSLGGVVAMKLLPKLDTPIASLLMVAPPLRTVFRDNKKRPMLEKACDWQFDFADVKAKAENITVLYDIDDSVVFPDQPQEIAAKLGAPAIGVVANGHHFNSDKESSILELLEPHVTVFTTRPDTLFGATFMVLAPEHELVAKITTPEQKAVVDKYVTAAAKKSEVERQAEKDKTGVFTGAYAINPANDAKIPIWIADYVLSGYGTGAIMAVPAHDERDNEFAKKFDLPIVRVVKNDAADDECSHDEGVMINSGEFDGQPSADARENIVKTLSNRGVSTEKVNYKMRDWSVSRQRYWGAPIPIINCSKCGAVAVPDDQLPVILPELDDFAPNGDGRSALARATDWLNVDCPQCGGPAERETDTLDTYICSSWYMLRYLDPHNQQAAFASDIANKWMPVDFYNGGDHATAHLLYARFVTRFFTKIGLLDNPEPFKQMLFNGKVTASDGAAFSKSKGNGIDPLEIIDQGYGADALRTYLMFAAPLEIGARWDPQGVPGTHRFLSRVWTLVQEYNEAAAVELSNDQAANLNRAVHGMIKKVTEDLEGNRYNTAIAAAMACVNDLYKLKTVAFGQNDTWCAALEAVVACIAPFAPHTSEELWHQLGHSTTVHRDSWPQYDEKFLAQDQVTIAVQVNGKLRGEVQVAAAADQAAIEIAAKADNKIAGYLNGEIKKVIFVPGKLVNFVI